MPATSCLLSLLIVHVGVSTLSLPPPQSDCFFCFFIEDKDTDVAFVSFKLPNKYDGMRSAYFSILDGMNLVTSSLLTLCYCCWKHCQELFDIEFLTH